MAQNRNTHERHESETAGGGGLEVSVRLSMEERVGVKPEKAVGAVGRLMRRSCLT